MQIPSLYPHSVHNPFATHTHSREWCASPDKEHSNLFMYSYRIMKLGMALLPILAGCPERRQIRLSSSGTRDHGQ